MFEPINKPTRPPHRSADDNQELAIPKPGVRDRDPAAAAGPRAEQCERCGRHASTVAIHWHHVKSRGAGGSDAAVNRIDLCAVCHDLAHRGRIPRAELLELIRRREERRAGDDPAPRRDPTHDVLGLPADPALLPTTW